MSQFTEADSSVNRLNAAVTAFEKVLTEPEGTVVEMPIGAAQPSLAERLKRAVDAVTVKPAQAAAQASAAAQQAQAAQQSAAQSAADAANSAAATGYVDAPFPDVWAPLSDDLRLLAGSAPADTITVAGTSYPLPSKSMTFTRSTTATYIDKSGVLKTAAVNEPRFEKEGLLIEGQSTNYILNSDDPSKWGSHGSITDQVIVDGVTQAVTYFGTVNAATPSNNHWIVGTPTITAAAGEIFTISARFKSTSDRVRFRFALDNVQIADVAFDGITGARAGGPSGGATYTTSLGSDGYIYASMTIAVASAGSLVGQIWFNGTANIAVGAAIYVQTVQVEKNAFTTSYIPTGASAVTRAADDCTLQRSGNDNYFGPVTFAMEVHCNGQTVASSDANNRRGIISYYPSSTEWVFAALNSSPGSSGRPMFCYASPALVGGRQQ
ncbi:hypothetical protein ACE3K1_01075 [Enterobacter hormaechei subsp. hoffmannii]